MLVLKEHSRWFLTLTVSILQNNCRYRYGTRGMATISYGVHLISTFFYCITVWVGSRYA